MQWCPMHKDPCDVCKKLRLLTKVELKPVESVLETGWLSGYFLCTDCLEEVEREGAFIVKEVA